MAQSNGCEQFQVGTRKWNDCIHDQATGGGLMPWIVVIPLGVMVLGMMIGFARQFSGAGRERARAHGAAGTAGTWLIFVSLIELSIGVGSLIAARKAPGEGGGYDISATVLLGVGILLFVIGFYLKIRGWRRARIYHSGVPGEAIVKAIHETGTMVNNQPMYGFDLEVTGQGFAPVSTRHREVVPFWYLNRIGPQSRVPVKVDPSNPTRVIFDWDRLATNVSQGAAAGAPLAASLGGGAAGGVTAGGVAGEVAQGLVPGADSLADAMQAARELTGRGGSGWHVGKAIGLGITLFIFLIVGGALFFVARVFGQVTDATSNASNQVAEALDQANDAFGDFGGKGGAGGPTTIEVSRAARGRGDVSFSIELPAAWTDVTGSVSERQGPVLIDVMLAAPAGSEGRIIVSRSVDYLQNPAPAGDDIRSIRKSYEQEFGDSITRSRLVRLAGEPAVALDIAPGADGLQSRQIAVMRDGQVLLLNLTARKSEWRAMLAVFDRVAASWRWGTASA
ncbi:MAG: hypothetical protein M3134_05805 [Actinomycetota bacterium]|nr:hypothetical protein [Actinomycetota bacterium]